MNSLTKAVAILAAASAVLVGAAFCQRAEAQPALCATEGQFLQSLAEKHGELPVFRGTSSIGPVMIVTASPAGSFTTLIVFPAEGEANPRACLVNEGEDGVTFNVKVTPKGRQS